MRIVFAGPSTHGLPAEAFTGVDVRPPARRSDVPTAVQSGARAILLIDGAFGEAPTVSHKEILAALDAGIRIGGAASLGAIRAAECAPWGMVGIGGIYAEYASARRTSDADVVLCHAPTALGHAPTTLSLVDCEASLRALPPGALTLAEVTALLACARSLHFSSRTWEAAANALPAARRTRAIRLLRQHQVHRKRADAELGLNWLRGG